MFNQLRWVPALASLVLTIGILSVQPATATAPPEATGVGNVAHRGSSNLAPENTMAAIRQAVAQKADFVGIDVRLSRDGHPVVLHDADLRRTTNVEQRFPHRRAWPVDDFTLAQIKTLDAGSWRSSIYTGERVPTLGEMLTELNASHTGAFLEVKKPGEYGGVNGIGQKVVNQLLAKTDWLDADGRNHHLVVESFDAGFLEGFAAEHPDIATGFLDNDITIPEMAQYDWADHVSIHHTGLTTEEVAVAHQLGLQVSTWVVNDAARMKAVVGWGVDAVSTDYPGVLDGVLRRLGRRLNPEQKQPPSEPAVARISLSAPTRAAAASRVPVRVLLNPAAGQDPVRWQWVQIQSRQNGVWTRLQRRVTDRFGELDTTVTATPGMRIRAVLDAHPWYVRATSTSRSVEVYRVPSRLRLHGPRRLVDERSAILTVRWNATNGKHVTGSANLWSRRGSRPWRFARQVRVREGAARVVVRPRVDTRYELRGKGGWWWAPDVNRHRINVL